MKLLFFGLAIICWAISLVVHFITFTDITFGESPLVWILHIGVFIVMMLSIFYLNKNEELKSLNEKGMSMKEFSSKEYYGIIYRNTPTWFKNILIVCAVYAFVNFGIFMYNHPQNGNLHSNIFIRGVSGHWFFFYGAAAGILWPERK